MGRPRSALRQAVATLAAEGRTDLDIAATLGLPTAEAVRSLRRRMGLVEPRRPWRPLLEELHRAGCTNQEIAARTGWGVRTIRNRLSILGLRSHRGPAPEAAP